MSLDTILSAFSPSQLMLLMDAPDLETVQMYLKSKMSPTNQMKNIVAAINDALSFEGFIAKHATLGSTNAVVTLPKTFANIAQISVLSMHGSYELALLNASGSLEYIPSIGYDSWLPSFDTPDDVINEIKRIYSELQKI
jgi:hypothetical protein